MTQLIGEASTYQACRTAGTAFITVVPYNSLANIGLISVAGQLQTEYMEMNASIHHSIEDTLIEIWEKILRKTGVDIGDNFFALGGDSLSATAMIVAVEEKLAKGIPVGQIYLTPILQEFAHALANLHADDNAPLYIPLNQGSAILPLWAIAPAVGGVFHFRDLAAALPDTIPVSVIEPRFSASGSHRYDSIEEVAEGCLEVLKAKQPQGPYRLCGYSFGGIIAWEMAKSLESSGDTVDILLFLDSKGRTTCIEPENQSMTSRILSKIRFLHECSQVRNSHGEPIHWKKCGKLLARKITNSVKDLFPTKDSKSSKSIPEITGPGAMQIPSQEKLRTIYDPGHYSGRIVLFRAEDQFTLHRELDFDLGWGKHVYSGNLNIQTLPGDHFNLVRQPNVNHLAKAVTGLWEEAENRIEVSINREHMASAKSPSLPLPEPVNGESLLNRFRQVTEAFADLTAIRDGGTCLTFSELANNAEKIATFISLSDPESSKPIGLRFQASWQFICAVYGVLLAGRSYLPLDPEFPYARTKEIIDLSDLDFVLGMDVDEKLVKSCSSIKMWAFDEAIRTTANAIGSFPEPDPDAPAILLYTSGSTGKPKGSIVTHKMLLHICWRRGTSCQLVPGDRYAMLYSSAFMGGVLVVHSPLLWGCTVVIYNLRKRGLHDLASWLKQERITVLHMITSIMRRFFTTWGGLPSLPDLRLLIPGGERSRGSDLEHFKSLFGDKVRFCACLGSTECGTLAINPLTRQYHHEGGPLPVGKPFKSLGIRILRSDGSTADTGEVGEIVAASHYIFRGYVNNSELNQKVLTFTDDGMAVYNTGDYGYINGDGVLYNIGRKDSRVKVNGNLVELAEVESAISLTGLVHEVAVLHRPVVSGSEEKQLVAFYRPKTGAAEGVKNRLIEALIDQLPYSMTPTIWIRLNAFPQTLNGKTDRKELNCLPLSNQATENK